MSVDDQPEETDADVVRRLIADGERMSAECAQERDDLRGLIETEMNPKRRRALREMERWFGRMEAAHRKSMSVFGKLLPILEPPGAASDPS